MLNAFFDTQDFNGGFPEKQAYIPKSVHQHGKECIAALQADETMKVKEHLRHFMQVFVLLLRYVFPDIVNDAFAGS